MDAKKLYEEFANDAISKLPQEDRASFDPITILMIVSILIAIARLIVACRNKKGSDVKEMAKNPSVYERRVLRRHLRDALGVKRAGLFGDKFTDVVLEVGSKYDEQKLQEMLDKSDDEE